MRPLLTVLLLTAAVPLAGAAPATAAPPRGTLVASPRFVPEVGPVLAGDGGLVWLRRRDDAVLDLWVAVAGEQPRRVQRFVGSDTERLRSAHLSASSTAVGLELFEVAARGPRRRWRGSRAAVVSSRTYLGALGQPLTQVARCAVADPRVRSIDVGESAAAFPGPGCRHTTVRSLAPDAGALRALPDGAYGARLAGPFEAWLRGADAARTAVVRDAASGREITALAVGGPIVDQALHADGTLALAYGTRLALVAPGAGAARPLALTLRAPQTVRWLGDGLAVVTADGSRPTAGVLQIVDRQGATAQRIVAFGIDRELMRHADVSASRAVWVARGCSGAQIRMIALPVASAPIQREPACRLRLRRPARLRGDRLRLAISCAGFSIDCAARVTVRAGRRLIARGLASYNHATPPFAAANLEVTAAGLRLLRGNRRTRVHIGARIGEAGPAGEPSPAGVPTRSAAQTLAVAP